MRFFYCNPDRTKSVAHLIVMGKKRQYDKYEMSYHLNDTLI